MEAGLTQLAVMTRDGANWRVLTHDRDKGAIYQHSWAWDNSRIYYDPCPVCRKGSTAYLFRAARNGWCGKAQECPPGIARWQPARSARQRRPKANISILAEYGQYIKKGLQRNLWVKRPVKGLA